MMIADIESIKVPNDGPWVWLFGILCGMVFFAGAPIFVLLTPGGPPFLLIPGATPFVMTPGGLLIVYSFTKYRKWMKTRVEMYYCHLSAFDMGMLAKATTSQELSDKSRRIIFRFLCEKHPGWSYTN